MIRTTLIVLAACAPACAPALAQEPFIQHILTFQEVDAATGQPVPTPNGFLEPGEAALVSLSASFEPRFGTPLGEGTVLAMRTSMLHLAGEGGTGGTWGDLRLAPGWGSHPPPLFSPPEGLPVSSTNHSSIWYIAPGQIAEGASRSNPVENIWQGIWTPDHYEPRTAIFRTQGVGFTGAYGTSLWLEVAGPPQHFAPHVVRGIGDSIAIRIIPSCYADCNGDGALTIDDFVCFMDEYAAASLLPEPEQITHYANCTGATAAPVLTIDDFLCFMDAYAAGCP